MFLMVKFYYDPEKCELLHEPSEKRPIRCLKCLEVCPYSLLMFRPMNDIGEVEIPLRYEIYMTFKSIASKYCPDCLKCIDECPSQAIKIEF